MPETVAATFCATLVDEWARGGLTDAVVCPGSRSTPLALALAADARIRVHVHVDERSAAFIALGIGLESRRPAVVLVTSGTAAAELHPAVIEADLAAVPLLVCTADRPPELRDVAAPQTIDQNRLYGPSVRWYCDPGPADAAMVGSWRSLAARALAATTGAMPGPVHLNLPFRDPLVGEPGPLGAGRPEQLPWHLGVAGEDAERLAFDPGPLAEFLSAERGVIVAGDGVDGDGRVLALAAAAGWPVLADPRSRLRDGSRATVASFDSLLRVIAFAEGHRPEVVLRLGQPPASRFLFEWLAASGARQVAVDRYGRWIDPERTAVLVVRADPGALCAALVEPLGRAEADPSWRDSWATAEAAAQSAIGSVVDVTAELTEPGVARQLTGSLPAGTGLVTSSSMPIRDLEWYGAPAQTAWVYANRGANGIDGVLSTAVGVGLASGRPTVALVGDIAFVHDTNALVSSGGRDLDLVIVAVDNDGGGIFSFLPQANALEHERFEQLFATPHGTNLAALAAAHGVPCLDVRASGAFMPSVTAALAGGGVQVIRVRSERAANVDIHRRINAAVAEALAAAG